eukprot:3574000-Lingulodinium_polyedra.AAC.1
MAAKFDEKRADFAEKVAAATTDEAMLDAMKAMAMEESGGSDLSDDVALDTHLLDFFQALRQRYFNLEPTVVNVSICGKN